MFLSARHTVVVSSVDASSTTTTSTSVPAANALSIARGNNCGRLCVGITTLTVAIFVFATGELRNRAQNLVHQRNATELASQSQRGRIHQHRFKLCLLASYGKRHPSQILGHCAILFGGIDRREFAKLRDDFTINID